MLAAVRAAQQHAKSLCKGEPDPAGKCDRPACTSVRIRVVCSPDMKEILETGELNGQKVFVNPLAAKLCTLGSETKGLLRTSFSCDG